MVLANDVAEEIPVVRARFPVIPVAAGVLGREGCNDPPACRRHTAVTLTNGITQKRVPLRFVNISASSNITAPVSFIQFQMG